MKGKVLRLKIFFLDWASYGKNDVLDAFGKLGHSYILHPISDECKLIGFHNNCIESLTNSIMDANVDLVFSINYYPNLSEACERCHVKYIAWVYDNPLSKLYSINLINSCNYVFLFDYKNYIDLRTKFVNTVYYAPLAANVSRLTNITLTGFDQKKYGSDISFVGSLYNDRTEYNFYNEIKTKLIKKEDFHSLGLIDALIQSQMNIYGSNFLAKCLNEHSKILETFPDSFFDTTATHSHFTTTADVYTDHFLCREITARERKKVLELVSERFDTKLYTLNKDTKIGNCTNHGYVDSSSVAPKVFKASKLNLNITLRSIKTGIPLRAFEIMGSGGFLLTSYQEDFLRHFEPDIDFVYYSSHEELIDKASFYLKNDVLRNKIARSGYEKVANEHTYTKRIKEMIAVAMENE